MTDYRSYITSKEWRSKHKGFLQQSGYRCAFSGLKIGRTHRYNCHHMHYQNLGDEQYRRDIVCLHPWFHTWVIHGILSRFKRPSKQREYPNIPQRIAHVWCVLPGFCKAIALASILGFPVALSTHVQPSETGLRVWATSTQYVNHAVIKALNQF